MSPAATTRAAPPPKPVGTRRRTLVKLLFVVAATVFAVLSGVQLAAPASAGLLARLPWAGLGLAALLLLGGHALRAEKMIVLLAPLQPQCRGAVYRCLAIGFLFNVILPLRLGELIRAHLLGKRLQISRSATLMTIVFERIVDAVVLATLLVACVALYGSRFLAIAALLAAAAAVMIAALLAIINPSRALLHACNAFSAIFNSNYRDSVRLSAWSGIRFLQVAFRLGAWGRYALLSLLMWAFYLAAMLTVVAAVRGGADPAAHLVDAVICFVSSVLPLGQGNFGTYSGTFAQLAAASSAAPAADLALLALCGWTVLVGPTSLIGAYCLFRHIGFSPARQAAPAALDRLMRHERISPEFRGLLESYFAASPLVHELNAMEADGRCRNLRIFTGGSNAITTLTDLGDRQVVRKVTLLQHAGKLEAQRHWLERHQETGLVPHVLGEFRTGRTLVLDLEFRGDLEPFFSYIHRSSIAASSGRLDAILTAMQARIWTAPTDVERPEALRQYIQDKVVQKVADAARMHPLIARLSRAPALTVNGEAFTNLEAAVARIGADPRIAGELARFQLSEVHGDLTIDNLLVSDTAFLIIDPNDENGISDLTVDIAKLYQSLHSGYEFLTTLEGGRGPGRRAALPREEVAPVRGAVRAPVDPHGRRAAAAPLPRAALPRGGALLPHAHLQGRHQPQDRARLLRRRGAALQPLPGPVRCAARRRPGRRRG